MEVHHTIIEFIIYFVLLNLLYLVYFMEKEEWILKIMVIANYYFIILN